MTLILRIFFILIILTLLVSCNSSKHNKKGVEYDHLIHNLDADSIALLYAPDGDLGNIAHGRDSIRSFLLTFKNLKVLSQTSNTEFLKVSGDTSLQKGKYHQTVVVAAKDTVNVRGEYTATWVWISKSGWHIKRMETKPIK
jgi:ketosteroid isomerase-like protein